MPLRCDEKEAHGTHDIRGGGSKETLRAIITLVRPNTLFTPAIAVFLFTIIAGEDILQHLPLLIIGGFVLSMLNAFSNIINQVYDVQEDKISVIKCKRPVACGLLTSEQALRLAIAFLFAILLAIILIGNTGFALCIYAIMLFTFLYSVPPFKLKRILVLNSLVIAVCRGMIGWLSVVLLLGIQIQTFHLLVGLAFTIFVFGANSTKDIADIEGDRSAGVRTFANVFGKRFTLGLATVCSLVSILMLAAIINMWVFVMVPSCFVYITMERYSGVESWMYFYVHYTVVMLVCALLNL